MFRGETHQLHLSCLETCKLVNFSPRSKRVTMTKARLDGLYFLLLGSMVFVLLGAVLERNPNVSLPDFRALYYPARCLIHGGDPYNADDILRISRAENKNLPWDNDAARKIETRYIYPPTAFSFTIFFAMFPWSVAHILWITLTVASLIFSSFLIWDLGAGYAPIPAGILVGFLLANSELLMITGNVAGIAISLCAVACYCFLRNRFIPAGILCFAISLVTKPHDTGLVWICFLLAGGVYSKRALQTLGATVALSLPAVIWVWHVAPHWMQELSATLAWFSAPGGINESGLASTGAHGLGMLVSLQAVISVFWDDPKIYNMASYLISGVLLFIWSVTLLRTRPSRANLWLALAAVAALSMLPVYHRQQDTKLLLLTVPACAMLWTEGGLMGWLALVVNAAGFVLTGDLPWAVFLTLINHLHMP